jgi:hypothetical protein
VNPRRVSDAGRAALAAAVSDGWDWSLSASSEDRLIGRLDVLSDDDLQAARLLVRHLDEALACIAIRRAGEGSS